MARKKSGTLVRLPDGREGILYNRDVPTVVSKNTKVPVCLVDSNYQLTGSNVMVLAFGLAAFGKVD